MRGALQRRALVAYALVYATGDALAQSTPPHTQPASQPSTQPAADNSARPGHAGRKEQPAKARRSIEPADGAARQPAGPAASDLHPHTHEHRHGRNADPHDHSHGHAVAGHEHPPADPDYSVVVVGKRPITAASSRRVRSHDLKLRVIRRPADVLQVTPGLLVVQHAGGGKATQYFLRGFDIDHGTDLALFVDGVPVNMVSHGHGQGYAELHWLIPEIVDRIDVHKGTYLAQYGNFATAGAINLVTKTGFSKSFVKMGGGTFQTYRGVAAVSPQLDNWRVLFAGEIYGSDGPFDSGQDLKRYNLFSKIKRTLSGGGNLTLSATAYGSGWNASGQIPLERVRSGTLDRFGAIDPDEGGHVQRYSINAALRLFPKQAEVLARLYVVRYEFGLYSNFTFFSRDAENGDMIEQRDDRSILGAHLLYRFFRKWRSITFNTAIGAQFRSDIIDNALFYAPGRVRADEVAHDAINEGNISLYAEERITWLSWLRTIIGVRGDYLGVQVDDVRAGAIADNPVTGGREALRISPKASIVISPHRTTDVFLNFGTGFHSNDARAIIRGADAAPLALGYEIGARTRLFERLDVAASLFGVELESELVWVGDEGVTEASGRTRRLGAEFEARLKILAWLFIDADVTLTFPRFINAPSDSNRIPLAPRVLLSGGISVRHPAGVFGRANVVYLGDRPATEDGFLTAEGFHRVDLSVGYRFRNWFEIDATLQNLTATSWREAQFATTSRLPSQTSAADCGQGTRAVNNGGRFVGCEDIHFTPGAPINVQVNATVFF